jgi:hypothetical protein
MISERTLKRWRRDSLNPIFNVVDTEVNDKNPYTSISINKVMELHGRILLLTQQLMDLYLIQKGR